MEASSCLFYFESEILTSTLPKSSSKSLYGIQTAASSTYSADIAYPYCDYAFPPSTLPTMPPIQEDQRNHSSCAPVLLQGEDNLDEWKRNMMRALNVRGLLHVLTGSQDDQGCGSSLVPEISVDENDYFEVSKPMSFEATSGTECPFCGSDHSRQPYTNNKVDAASDMKAKLERQRSMERSEALLLMSQSLSSIHDWLMLHGFDACEEDPARYFQAVQDVFTRLSTWTVERTRIELQKIQPDPFKPIQAYQRRLAFLRNRYLRAEGPKPREEREREVLWWAIGGIKAWSTTLHARLVQDMMEAPESNQKLTWPRLMRQLAYIHECDKYDYVLGPDVTDG